jgi:hypothetical protein
MLLGGAFIHHLATCIGQKRRQLLAAVGMRANRNITTSKRYSEDPWLAARHYVLTAVDGYLLLGPGLHKAQRHPLRVVATAYTQIRSYGNQATKINTSRNVG